MKFFICLLPLLFLSMLARGHEVRPGFLELTQTAPNRFYVLWKVPGQGTDLRLALNVVFPKNTKVIGEKHSSFVKNAFFQRWVIEHPTALENETIAIDGLTGTMTDVILRIERLSGQVQVSRLTPQSPQRVVDAVPGKLSVTKSYLILGVEHILFGYDHLLFVLALFLLVSKIGMLVKTVTAFTVAHSITLVLTSLGKVSLPSPPVETSIALSILLLAGELARQRRNPGGLTVRWPWMVAFIFGLLHGFGFAGALAEFGLPHGEVPLALVMFNLGVEIGQLLFIGTLIGLQFAATKLCVPARVRQLTYITVNYAIGAAAVFWCFERLAGY